jgi:hypothetical protein
VSEGLTAWRKSSYSATDNCVEVAWRKSSFTGNTNCVEVAFGPAAVAVRDSKQPSGPQLHLTTDQWQTFVRSYLRFL